jgi:moderate conductance mechanosensitive channel
MQWLYDVPLRLAIIFLLAFAANRLVRGPSPGTPARQHPKSAAARDLDPDTIKRDALRVNTATSAIGGAATVVIFVIAGLIALGELGVTLGPLLAGAGIAGIALGFGAQNMVRDVLAGLFVVFEDHYGVGDIIDAGRATGTVEDVTLRITKVRDIEGTLWFIPNGTIEGVGNRTQMWARAIIDFDIDYRADHERAGEIIKETADRVWRDAGAPVRILEEPALWGVESLGDSSVVIRLAVKCAPAEQWALARLLRGEVKKALDAEGIEIPFPQHTVWVHGVPEGDALASGAAAGAVGGGRSAG